MSWKAWFGSFEKEEPALQEQRVSARISAHAQVIISDTPGEDSEDKAADANLVDFGSGGLRLRMNGEFEVGQTVWVRTTVTHVSQDGPSAEIGVTWDAEKGPVPALPLSASNEQSTPQPQDVGNAVAIAAPRSVERYASVE